MIVAHPQQPKLNQAFIFAGFMQARLAWFYQRKCNILVGDELDEFNQLVLSTQAEIELVFRPEQAQQLNSQKTSQNRAKYIVRLLLIILLLSLVMFKISSICR